MRGLGWPYNRRSGRICGGCGDDIYPGVKQWECPVCGAWPLCQVCRIEHEEEGNHMPEDTGGGTPC